MKLGKSPRWGQRYLLKQAQYFETSPARLIQLSLTSGQIVWWAGVKGSPASGGFTMPEFKSEWERYPHFCWHFSQDLRESQKSKCITFYFQNDPNQHSPIPSHSWQCCLSETSGHLSPSEEKNSIEFWKYKLLNRGEWPLLSSRLSADSIFLFQIPPTRGFDEKWSDPRTQLPCIFSLAHIKAHSDASMDSGWETHLWNRGQSKQ